MPQTQRQSFFWVIWVNWTCLFFEVHQAPWLSAHGRPNGVLSSPVTPFLVPVSCWAASGPFKPTPWSQLISPKVVIRFKLSQSDFYMQESATRMWNSHRDGRPHGPDREINHYPALISGPTQSLSILDAIPTLSFQEMLPNTLFPINLSLGLS